MKKMTARGSCCDPKDACELAMNLPDDYMDRLYDMYVADCKQNGNEPLPKERWIQSLA